MHEADGPAGVAKVIYFDFDSFVVKPEYQSVIDGHARHLQANRSRHVVLEGNTDERGGLNTTWRWAKSVLKPCAAHWAWSALLTRKSKP